MGDTAIPETDDIPVSDDDLRRRAIPVDAPGVQAQAPEPQLQAKAIPEAASGVGSISDLENRGLESHMAARPIPEARQPMQTGSLGDLEQRADQRYENPRSAPIQTGVASLWTKAEHIHNPVLRVLGEIGASGARALDTAGTILAPRVAAAIPGSTLNERANEGREEKQVVQNTDLGHVKAQTEEEQAKTGLEQAQTDAARNPKPKEDKPETREQVLAGVEAEDLDKGVNPADDPRVQQMQDSITSTQKEPVGIKVPPLTADQASQRNAIWDPILTKNHLPTGVFTEGMNDADAKELAAQLNNATGKTQAGVKIDMGAGIQGNTRSDKSYALQSKRLDDVRKPIEQIQQRVGRLNDTLEQKTPQADALVAPELLSIMSGGQGSGLRMNAAEIARIVGGRSAWESLKANLQHWATKPEDARSITPAQDKQIRALVSTVQSKLVAKQKIMDEAEERLLGSDDPKVHRQVVSDARKKLDAIDAGEETGSSGKGVSLSDARALPQNKGKSDDEIRKDIEAHHHTVIE